MPTAIVDPKNRDEPVLGTGFAVQIGGEVKGWFTECSGLTVEREVKAHQEGGVNDYVHQLPGRIKQSNLTLKHGLSGNELWDWFQKGMYNGQVERRNISIVLYDSQLTEIKRWDLTDVYPAKWTGPDFNSDKNDITVETLEFAHAGSDQAVQRMPDDEQSSQNKSGGKQAIDLAMLTNKVYALFKQELRLERERLGRGRRA